MAKRPETPSFVLELPLVASATETQTLLARLEAARQILNGCLGESLRRLSLLRQSKAFQSARAMPKGKSRSAAFAAENKKHGFQEYDFHAYAKQFGHSWLGEHVDSVTVQKLATRVFRAVKRHALGLGGRPRFKRYGQVDSVEGKDASSGIRWREGRVEWSGLSLVALVAPEDRVIQHGLKRQVKYVRIIRRKLNGKDRFFVQLVLDGKPYQKPEHKIGTALIGLDQGPSTMAAVAHEAGFAIKKVVCEELGDRQAEIRRLQRHLDRQRRANNPDNYNENGTVKKGLKKWKTSVRMITARAQLAEIHRMMAAYRDSLQGKYANDLLAIGNRFKVEQVSKKWFQKCFGRSVRHRAPGMLEARIFRKAESAGGGYELINTRATRLSQVCHCGAEARKTLGDTVHNCPNCGISCDRDLYSAFLATCVEGGRLDAAKASGLWPGVDALLRAASSRWYQQQASGKRKLSHGKKSFRRSLSPVAAETNAGEAHDVVAPVGSESVREPAGLLEPPALAVGRGQIMKDCISAAAGPDGKAVSGTRKKKV